MISKCRSESKRPTPISGICASAGRRRYARPMLRFRARPMGPTGSLLADVAGRDWGIVGGVEASHGAAASARRHRRGAEVKRSGGGAAGVDRLGWWVFSLLGRRRQFGIGGIGGRLVGVGRACVGGV